MFGLLSVFVFVNEYCNYFILLFALNVQYVGDNLGVINKLLNIKKQIITINYIKERIMMRYYG